MLTDDIRKDNEEQSYKNKHGLHKRPTEEKPQQLQVHLSAENFDAEMDVVEVPNIGRPPRVLSTVFDDGAEKYVIIGCMQKKIYTMLTLLLD